MTKAGGLGIMGMSERAAMIGGSFSLDSAPAQGTRVALSLPLPVSEVHA
jgi:signal transduction histidine kinase